MKAKTALIIIDVQRCMFENALPVHKGNELLDNVCGLIDRARASGVPVIYIQHTSDDEEAFKAGKPGWEIHPRIEPLKEDLKILKYTPDAFHETELETKLRLRNIENIVIAGLQTEYCVDTTCRRAFSLGYKTILAKDGHSTYDTPLMDAGKIIEHHNRVLGSWFVQLKPCSEIFFD